MIHQQIPFLNEDENVNRNFSLNLFPKLKLFEYEFPKEFLVRKDFQEKNDYFMPSQKFNFEPILDSSQLSSTEESPHSQNKNISLNNISSEEITQNKTKNLPIFQIDVNKENQDTKKFEDKLLMNRISARKSRLKKKEYIKCLEEETAKLKNQMILNKTNMIYSDNDNMANINIQKDIDNEKNKNFMNKIILLENQENEVKREGQKKRANVMKQHENLQKTLLREMLVKQIYYFIPLRYHIFEEKFIKLVKIDEDDSISVINSKINENIEKIKNYMNIVPKKRIKLVIKFHEIYKRIRNYVDNYQLLFSESFKY